MNENREAYVVIADDCGDTVALVGPFPSQAAAQAWADREEEKAEEQGFVSNALEPYVVLQLDKPEDFEEDYE